MFTINTKTVMEKKTDNSEIEKGKSHVIVKVIEYIPNAVLSKTIIKKITGNITLSSFDEGEEMEEKASPFDIFIQVIDGSAEITINDKLFKLKKGEGIVIPAHSIHSFNANEKFKMLSTVIKSGYED